MHVLFRSSAKAAVILLPVFGLTWVFGLLAVNEDTVVFAWIFTVINSLQVIIVPKITIYQPYIACAGFIHPRILCTKK